MSIAPAPADHRTPGRRPPSSSRQPPAGIKESNRQQEGYKPKGQPFFFGRLSHYYEPRAEEGGGEEQDPKTTKLQRKKDKTAGPACEYLTKNVALKALSGDVDVWSKPALTLRAPSGVLRIFLSSTFTDTFVERDRIIANVAPKLRYYGLSRGINVQMVELRWGIQDTASADHLTWDICRDELQKCYDLSMGPFFVSLVSEKYGWRALPRTISEEHWHLIASKSKSGESDAYIKSFEDLKLLYAKDENVVPPQWTLLRLDTPEAKSRYNTLSEPCRSFLELCIQDWDVGRSVTHWETTAAVQSGERDRLMWIHRRFSDLDQWSCNPSYRDFIDFSSDKVDTTARELLRGILHTELRANVDNVVELTTSLTQAKIAKMDAKTGQKLEVDGFVPSESYLAEMCEVLLTSLQKHIDNAESVMENWRKNAAHSSLPGDVMGECLHHLEWARKKQRTFFHRYDLLDATMSHVKKHLETKDTLQEYIVPPSHCHPLISSSHLDSTRRCDVCGAIAKKKTKKKKKKKEEEMWLLCERCQFSLCSKCCKAQPAQGKTAQTPLACRVLALLGSSGCGKTALMAKLGASLASIDRPHDPWVILRFCGTSRYSATGHELIKSICHQLLFLLESGSKKKGVVEQSGSSGGSNKKPIPAKYDELVEYFHQLLNRVPKSKTLYLLLDSLDQLDDAGQVRKKLNFLPAAYMPSNVFFIISCIPDDERYKLGCDQRIADLHIPTIKVNRLSEEEGLSIFESLLEAEGHQIKNAGLLEAVRAAVKTSGSPLFLRLIVSIVKTFRSGDKVDDISFTHGIREAISFLLTGIETVMGEVLVSHALAYLTFSRFGVSEDELIDLLSLDEEVLRETFRYWDPPVRRMPQLPPLRLLRSLGDLIVTKGHGLLQWYHRQLWECAEDRYRHLELFTRESLASYFTQRRSSEPSIFTTRLIKAQPLLLMHGQPNRRRCHEGAYQLEQLVLATRQPKFAMELIQELCMLEAVEARAHMDDNELFEASRALGVLEELLPSMMDTAGDKDHGAVQRARQQTIVKHFAYWLRREGHLLKRSPAMVYASAMTQPRPESTVYQMASRLREQHIYPEKVWGEVLPPVQAFDACLAKYEGHSNKVEAVTFTPDGKKVVSGSMDHCLRVWDLRIGICEKTFEGHSSEVTSVAVTADGQYAISGSGDYTVRLWELQKGVCWKTLEGHTGRITGLSTFLDVSATTQEARVTKIISSSEDCTLRLWEAVSGTCEKIFRGHDSSVDCVAVTSDANRIVSGARDNELRVWNLRTGRLERTLDGHKHQVRCVAVTPDDRYAVSGSRFHLLRLWNLDSGVCERVFETDSGPASHTSSVVVLADGKRMISGSSDGVIFVWDMQTTACERVLEGHSSLVNSVAIAKRTHNGKQLAASGSCDNSIRLWELEAANLPGTASGGYRKADITCVAVTPDGKHVLSGSKDQTLSIWDSVAGVRVRILEGHTCYVFCLAVSADGGKIVSGSSDHTLRIWNFSTGVCEKILKGHSSWISSVGVTSNGSKVLSGSYDRTLRIWTPQTESSESFKVSDEVMSISVAVDDTFAVSASRDFTVRVWDLKQEGRSTCVRTIKESVGCVICLSPDGKKFIAPLHRNLPFDRTGIAVWNLQSEQCEKRYMVEDVMPDSGRITSLAISADGERVISGTSDHLVDVWELQGSGEGGWKERLVGHTNEVTSVALSAAGHLAVSASKDLVRVWHI